MTQRALARIIGVTHATICLIENGRRHPTVPLARKIAQEFGVSIEALFEQVEIPA